MSLWAFLHEYWSVDKPELVVISRKACSIYIRRSDMHVAVKLQHAPTTL